MEVVHVVEPPEASPSEASQRAEPAPEEPKAARRPWADVATGLPWLGAGAAGVLLLLWAGQAVHTWMEQAIAQGQAALETATSDAGTSAVGDTSLTAPLAPTHAPTSREAVALDEPPKLLPGQRQVDAKGQCPEPDQIAINGGCWVDVGMSAKACERNGFVYLKGKCYAPSFAPPRKPTSEPREPR